MNEFIKNELSGWKRWEITWLLIATVGITTISIILSDDFISIIAAITGIICVILGGKGKLSNYFFGILHIIFYAFISFNSKYYGIVMLNLFYYLPMQFYGFHVWKKNMNPKTNEVFKKSLSLKNTIILLSIVLILTIIYTFILQYLNGNLPFMDALSTIVAIVAIFIAIKRYSEQWLLWIIVNIVTAIMWTYAFLNGTGHIAILIMSIIYLINSSIMYLKWKKESSNL